MKKLLLTALALAFLAATAFAQMDGSVSGTVTDSAGAPVGDAMVRLTTGEGGHHGGHGGHGENYSAQTADDGTFSIPDVGVGNYIANASKMMVGHDSEEITVTAGNNTVVNFVLTMGGHDGGGMHGDSLEIVELTGWAIVVADSFYTHYFLDTNFDDVADYRLMFGPEWYDPGNGAQRPADGDSIWITGGLMGYSDPQPVVVYEINDLFWRTPGEGHGGHGGGGGGYPHPDSLELIETSGFAIVDTTHWMDMYFLDTNHDDVAEYHLNFGAPDYDPGNGATRPADGDSIDIVGGLMDGRMGQLDMIIVYEINGLYWRDPGDTTLLWLEPTGVVDPEIPQLPRSFVTAYSYPNPFNATAVISFDLRQESNVRVTIYDVLGKQMAIIADGAYPAGKSEVLVDMNNMGGSAIYFYRVDAGGEATTGKMTLLK